MDSDRVHYRATPLQKASLVRLTKENLKAKVLAIGDGANDVSMIQVRREREGKGGKGVSSLTGSRCGSWSIGTGGNAGCYGQ